MARKLRQIIARGSTSLVRTYQLLCCRRRDTAGGIGSLVVAARPSTMLSWLPCSSGLFPR